MSRFTAGARRTFSSLHTSRSFRLYFVGQVISVVGTWMNATATAWLVWKLTRSGTALGVNTGLLFLPILLLGAFGGVIADRFDKRKILMWTQAAQAASSVALFALVFTDVVTLPMVYALSVASGIVTALDNPTRQSFYVEMVGEEDLTNAVSLNSAMFMGARVVGPALAGFIIHYVDLSACFLFDALSYVAVITALAMMRPQDLHPQKRTTRERGHLMAGFRYVWRTDELRRPLLVLAIVCTFSFNWAVLVPLLAVQTFHGDPGTLGALSAMTGLGSLAGALFMANRAAKPTMYRLALFTTAAGVALIVGGLPPTLGLAYLFMIPMGLALMVLLITANSMLQLAAKPEARGRVMALYSIVLLGSTPIGAPITGWIGEQAGARWAFFANGAVALVTGLVLLWHRRHARAAAEFVPSALEQDAPDVPGETSEPAVA
jgi:MFS family permease